VKADPQPVSADDFAHVVRFGPLVSIDFIITDPEHNVLLGLRTNEPAKGYYFVPGGVIRKNETVGRAFQRILEAETGVRASIGEANFLGVFEHFYDTNRFGDPRYGTHYVVLAYELRLDHRPNIALDSQHNEFVWMPATDMASARKVHDNVKAYFPAGEKAKG
jgi:colanic acid biosynthesis protein WcaH